MKVTLAKDLFPKALKVGDSVPFSEHGMYVGNGKVVGMTDTHYEVELDNRVTENVDRISK
ncbi:UNVERIFIED_CONTAM: hypothetical protein ABID98_000192 [Brevibacillus sp. OAP136]